MRIHIFEPEDLRLGLLEASNTTVDRLKDVLKGRYGRSNVVVEKAAPFGFEGPIERSMKSRRNCDVVVTLDAATWGDSERGVEYARTEAKGAKRPLVHVLIDYDRASFFTAPSFTPGQSISVRADNFDEDVAALIDKLENLARKTSPGGSQRHVFVSYSHSDQNYVDKLVIAFADRGIKCWIDKDIDYGSRWARVIKQQLKAAFAVVVVVTPAAEDSDWVEKELQYAESLRLPILPLHLDGDRWLHLSNLQHADVKGGALPPGDWFTRLLKLSRRS